MGDLRTDKKAQLLADSCGDLFTHEGKSQESPETAKVTLVSGLGVCPLIFAHPV